MHKLVAPMETMWLDSKKMGRKVLRSRESVGQNIRSAVWLVLSAISCAIEIEDEADVPGYSSKEVGIDY